MEQNQARFESFPWEMEILELEWLFDILDDFLNDEQTKSTYIKRKHPKDTFISNDGSGGDPDKILPIGVQVFRRQMVVLLRTYLEKMTKDFARNVFIGNPDGYLRLPKYKDIKSTQELERKLSENKPIIPNELPQIAAKQVVRGKLSEILNRIEQISKANIKQNTKNTLVELNRVRTHIVHDASNQEISNKFLYESFEAVRDLIVSFREVCAENNISDVEEFDELNDWE